MAEYEHDKLESKREGSVGGEGLEVPLEAAEDTSLDRRIIFKTDAVVLSLVTIVATLEFLDKNVRVQLTPGIKQRADARAWRTPPSGACAKKHTSSGRNTRGSAPSSTLGTSARWCHACTSSTRCISAASSAP